MPFRTLLHRLSLSEGVAELIPTSREKVRQHAFIDGRTNFACGPTFTQSFDSFVDSYKNRKDPERYIFHLSFCGSTLLSRILDVPGRALVLREPNCLANLSNQRAAAYKADVMRRGWASALGAVSQHLAQPWAETERVIIKPSNWANILAPELCADPSRISPLFLTTDRQSFVEAIFRGGPDRLAYTARSAVHLSNANVYHAELVAAALSRDADQLGKLAALGTVAHWIQSKIFDQVACDGGWSDANRLSLTELIQDPLSSAIKAAAALDVEIPRAELQESFSGWSEVHAKQPEVHYSETARIAIDQSSWSRHGDVIEAALDWAKDALGD